MNLSALSPEAVSLYKKELMLAYKRLAFEMLIAVLLLVAIAITNHWVVFMIEMLMAIKIFISFDDLHLLKTGKITYLKFEEWENLQ